MTSVAVRTSEGTGVDQGVAAMTKSRQLAQHLNGLATVSRVLRVLGAILLAIAGWAAGNVPDRLGEQSWDLTFPTAAPWLA